MDNPFKTSASAAAKPAAVSRTLKVLLLTLAGMTAYMLARDISFLLITAQGTLRQAASLSFVHHVYLAVFPLEIAYFRLASSAAMLAFILFSIRNDQALARHRLFLYAYGTTQLIYQLLAVTGVIGTLSQISGNRALELSFWLTQPMLSHVGTLLLGFTLVLLPPIAFLLLCVITVAKIKGRPAAA